MTQNEARALSLFRVLLGNTKVLILDAPLEGLDNENKTKRLKEIILQAKGRTLVMGMVEPIKMKYFDRVVVLKNGQIEFEGPIESWKSWREERNPKENLLPVNSTQPDYLEVEEA